MNDRAKTKAQLRAELSEARVAIARLETVLDGLPIFTGYLRDITERRRSEEALRDSETRFRAIFEQSALSMQLFAPDGTFRRCNAVFEELFGTSGEEMPRLHYNLLKDPQLAAKGTGAYIERGFVGEPTRAPPILFELKPVHPGATKEAVWVGGLIYPIKDSAGAIVEVLVVHADVSDRMRAEEAILQANRDLEQRVTARTAELNTANEELARVAKLKDEFLASVSHELRTPLAGELLLRAIQS